MSNKKHISKDIVKQMVKLSNLSVDSKEQSYFTRQFEETLKTIDKLNQLNTDKVPGTDQVTGLSNIFREDKIEKERMLSQKEALSNAKSTYKGYFLVKAIFDEQ